MKTSPEGIALIKSFEGCILKTYNCSAGVKTIGYGHTGPDVKAGMVITQELADSLLRQDLHKFETGVTAAVKRVPEQCEFDALVAFSFNVGLGALQKSTLLRKLNADDVRGAADEFLKWDKAGGKQLAGLTRRRKAERAMFIGQDWRKA